MYPSTPVAMQKTEYGEESENFALKLTLFISLRKVYEFHKIPPDQLIIRVQYNTAVRRIL
jgi:hypothetical protein